MSAKELEGLDHEQLARHAQEGRDLAAKLRAEVVKLQEYCDKIWDEKRVAELQVGRLTGMVDDFRNARNRATMENSELKLQVGVWKEYAELLDAEITSMAWLANAHGWVSSRSAKGLELRKKLGIQDSNDVRMGKTVFGFRPANPDNPFPGAAKKT